MANSVNFSAMRRFFYDQLQVTLLPMPLAKYSQARISSDRSMLQLKTIHGMKFLMCLEMR
jgi:hypothetical protein